MIPQAEKNIYAHRDKLLLSMAMTFGPFRCIEKERTLPTICRAGEAE